MINICYKKNRIIQAFSSLLMLVILSISIGVQRSHAQTCYTLQGCSDYSNFGYNSTTAATLEYDNYVSGFHSTAVRDIDGSFKVWGEQSMADGVNDWLVPTTVNAGNYPGLTGTPLKMAIGSGSINSVQYILLTSDNKLWVWGTPGVVFSTSLKSTNTFGQLSIGLPAGVTAANVKMMFAHWEGFMITTCDGSVYSINQYWAATGDNATTTDAWVKVQKDAAFGGGDLNNIVAARGGGEAVYMALDNTGQLWTWGYEAWNGSTAKASRQTAVRMTLPSGATGNIKMIGMSHDQSRTSYYVLYENGNLYALGDNTHRQLGDWTTTNSNTWVQPRYASGGAVMNDIKWISPNEHSNSYTNINVLTNGMKIYNWGDESGYDLGRGVQAANGSWTAVNPGEPIQFEGGYTNSNIIAIESGGHTTMALRLCASDFGYVGHRVNGSMGDNNDLDNTDNVFHYTTNAVQVCGASTVAARLNASVEGPYYVGNSVQLMGSPSGGTYTLTSGPATLSGTTLTFTGAGTVRASYTVADATCGTVTVNRVFAVTTATAKVTIPGNIWNDANGNAVRNTGEAGLDNGLWANLTSPGGNVIASVKVNADGTYQFDLSTTDIATSGNYAVVLTNSSRKPGDALSSAETPANGYSYTGVNRATAVNGTTGVNTSNQTGKLVIGDISSTAGGSTLSPVNLGIKPAAVSISGTVFNDANGLNPSPVNTVDGTGTNAGGLNAILYDNTTGQVVGTSPVSATGAYSFSDIAGGNNYTVYITTATATIGQTTPPAVTLPAGWVPVGEQNCGTVAGCTGSDGTANGILALNTVNTNITAANFGIERTPDTQNKTQAVAYPTGGIIPAGVITTDGTGSDPEDGALSGSTGSLTITQLPANATMYYNGNPVTLNMIISSFNPALLSFTGITAGATSVQFTYAMRDAAGIQDPTPATYTLSWSTPLPVVLESFKASSINCDEVILNWQVRSAMNFNRFVIERSQEGNLYESIATVAYNPALKSYTYSDEHLKKGQYQYRIKLIDVDGTSQYSPTITQRVDCNQQSTVLYPNPVRDLLSISNTQSGDVISVYSADGKTIKSFINYHPGTAINVADLAAGTYRLTINRNGQLLESLAFNKL